MRHRHGSGRVRAVLAPALVLALMVTGLTVYIVTSDGFRPHDARLHDGGIWVTNNADGFHGRVNKPIDQLDGALFARLDADLDVVQDGIAVVAVNRSDGIVSPIANATVSHPQGERAAIPSGALVAMGGNTVAVADPASGEIWAQRVNDGEPTPSVASLDQEGDPLAEIGGNAALAVTASGAILAVSANEATLTRIDPVGRGFAAPESEALPGELADDLSLDVAVSAAGDTPVVLDRERGLLHVIGGVGTTVPEGSVLQQAGGDGAEVLLTSDRGLHAVDLEDGAVREVAEATGRPAVPVRLGACRYGAWSGGVGTVATQCGDDEPRVSRLGIATSDLVFRVNRDEIVLNDRATGAVWSLDSEVPTQLDHWDAFKREIVEAEDETEEQDQRDDADRRPPVAVDDRFGARPGRTTVLHPLDNDSAPAGRILAIRSVQNLSGNDAEIQVSPDGQSVQLRLPRNASGSTRFDYTIDDGRSDMSASASVIVDTRPDDVNDLPVLREGYQAREWTVPAGGVLDVPVLAEWRDPGDGDPLSVSEAVALRGNRTGATARVTATGRIRFNAPAQAGTAEVEYFVTDGRGAPVSETLTFQVQDRTDRTAIAGVAEPDIVTGEVGKPIQIRPLANDLPGSDPTTPDAQLTLAGRVPAPGGTRVQTDLVDGSLTFRANTARTYFLDYDAAYGNAPLSRGRVRVDVRPPSEESQPIAMPDAVTVYDQAPAVIDVLANDIDPAGGMLVVQSAKPDQPGQLDVAVIDGRWLRISARQSTMAPNPQQITYRITNGSEVADGEVTVSQQPAPEEDAPVTEVDRVTVRAGSSAAINVLDNDFSPSGDPLSLVAHPADEPVAGELTVTTAGDANAPTGQAFVVGRQVRYVAPSDLRDDQRYVIRYLAQNTAGATTPGRVEVTVVPQDAANQSPEPPALEGRVVAGGTIRLKLPGEGIDPDGDAVTLTGIGSAPRLGRIVSFGADALEYQAFPGRSGTDEFSYTVTDGRGGIGTGTARVAVAQPGVPQPPLAVPDAVTVEPGRTASVDVLANDLIAAGDRVTVSLVDPPDGVRLASDLGPVVVDVPPGEPGRSIEVVYRLSNGISSSRSTVTVRTSAPFNNPPIVFDAYGTSEDGATVTVDVLGSAYDPDGPDDQLRVTDVFTAPEVETSISGGEITIARGLEPSVVPFRVVDGDGGASMAVVYVPAADANAPFVRPGALIELGAGDAMEADLDEYVVNPAGGEVRFPLADQIWASPSGDLQAEITDDTRFALEAPGDYEGPGAVTFEVTTGVDVDDPEGIRAVLTVPVQVGSDQPILRCPDEPVEVVQGESVTLDVASICHAWTPELGGADPGLEFTADWEQSVPGLSIIRPEGRIIELAAESTATPDVEAMLQVRTGSADPGRLAVRVVEAPPPALAPVRIADMEAGETRTIDMAQYLRPGVSDPEPTVVSADQITGLDVAVSSSGSEVTLAAGSAVSGEAEFRVVMSDLADGGPQRQVEGRISLEILDVPATPDAPIPGQRVRSQEVSLSWRAPEANGAPITGYELRANDGRVTPCGGTSCDVGGLTNGDTYRFEVRAQNAVGWSEWSAPSNPATPDAAPGRVGPIRMVDRGDRTLTLEWDPPTTQTSAIERYHVTWRGGQRVVAQPRVVINELDNNLAYTFTVEAQNALDIGPQRVSPEFQSIGNPGTPEAPAIDHEQTGGDAGVVVLTWPEVDPNGPSPVHYTVLRNGEPLPACTNTPATRCENSGITYDGTTYRYVVRATNEAGAGKSSDGEASTWSAVGRPAEWRDDWTVSPTGTNNQARVQFEVPNSRGGTSRVRVRVGSNVVDDSERRGQQGFNISVPNNSGPHNVRLEVCNEQNACSQSSTKSVQTYGPLTNAHISAMTSEVSGTRIRWRVTANGNGRPARLVVERPGGNNQTFNVPGPGSSTFTTAWVDRGFSARETATARLSDPNVARGTGTRQATSGQTDPPPPPQVSVSKGARCQDGTSAHPNCFTGAPGSTQCTNSSCARIVITTRDFSGNVTCTLRASTGFTWSTQPQLGPNERRQLNSYFGIAGETVSATCSRSGESASGSVRW